MPLDPLLLRPTEDRQRGQLGAVVVDSFMRLGPHADQRRELRRAPHTR